MGRPPMIAELVRLGPTAAEVAAGFTLAVATLGVTGMTLEVLGAAVSLAMGWMSRV